MGIFRGDCLSRGAGVKFSPGGRPPINDLGGRGYLTPTPTPPSASMITQSYLSTPFGKQLI